jgi:UDP-glucose 4-epimerase
MRSRRILITGLSSHWGGRLAQLLEREPEVEAIIGVDTTDPRHELHRTEFVRVDTDEFLLARIIKAAAVDTVVDTRLIEDPLSTSLAAAQEVNVNGTRHVLIACSGPGSPVKKLVFKSSAQIYGCEADDPAFFAEEMTPTRPPRTALVRDIAQAERGLADFAAANPDTTLTTLRFADAIGSTARGSHLALLGLPVVPVVLGFDPRFQFIHEDDVIGVLAHAVRNELPGVYNAAADGVLALSEVVGLLGKPLLPVLPPWGTVFAAAQLRRLGLRIPVEVLRQLRYGRGLDNRRLKATGYLYGYTTREAVLKLRAQQRLRPLLGSGQESYRYEREVEEFLRWSPTVRSAEQREREITRESPHPSPPPKEPQLVSYESLSEGELIEAIWTLQREPLERLRELEEAARSRPRVLDAIDDALSRATQRR